MVQHGFPMIGVALLSLAVQAKFPTGRVIAGHEVTPKFKYPWMASLQYDDEHVCGGTWYAGNSVITAASSIFGDDEGWTAKVHRHNLAEPAASEGGLTFQVLKRIPHPRFEEDEEGRYDVAVWKLDAEPAESLIRLDREDSARDPTILYTVIGWGSVNTSGSPPVGLQELQIPLYANDAKCRRTYALSDFEIQFCAGDPNNRKLICAGDQGSPLVVANTLVGLVSWGVGCGTLGKPDLYTRISAVADFIDANV